MDEDPILPFLRTTSLIGSSEPGLARRETSLDTVLANILATICQTMNARQCVLWESSLDLDLAKDPPEGRLFAVHSTFPPKERVAHAQHPADLVRDFTGREFRKAATGIGSAASYDNEVLKTDKDAASTPFLAALGLGKVCTAQWDEGGGNSGSLSVYRANGNDDFSEVEAEKLRRFALYVPGLLHFATVQMVTGLIRNVSEGLYDTDPSLPSLETVDGQRQRLDRVCRLLSETFVCEEASTFLNTGWKGENPYQLMGTNRDYAQIVKKAYQPSKDDGLTGYVLESRKPVVVFAEDRLDAERNFYPGIRWLDGARLEKTQTVWSNEAPRSFLGVPIFAPEQSNSQSQTPLGVIRCSIRTGRYYFSRRDTEILQLVASLIGVWWVRQLASRNRVERKRLWEVMAEISDGLNEKIHKVLNGVAKVGDNSVPSKARQPLLESYAELVKTLQTKISGAMAVTVRRAVPGGRQRTFDILACYPDATVLSENEVWRDAGATAEMALQKGEPITRLIPAASGSPSGAVLLCVPMSIAEEHFGVLDFLFHDADQFEMITDPFALLARTMGRQLALYEFLIQQVIRLEELKASQLQAYASVAHQLKSPALSALQRANAVLLDLEATPDRRSLERITYNQKKVAGNCRKTKRVADNMEVLARIAQNRPVVPKHTANYAPEEIFKFTREILEDHQFNQGYRKNKKVDYGTASADLRRLTQHTIRCDSEFLMQVLDAVVDNAFKYSFRNSTIRLSVEKRGKYILMLRIGSTGIKLSDEEAQACTERSFRGVMARRVDQNGSGLGLWIAKVLMTSQKGLFEAHPTNEEGETLMEIGLPLTVATG